MRPPRSRTLPALLAEQAHAAADAPALLARLGDRTYGELASRAASVGAALSGLGVGRGDTVGLLAPNIPEWLDAAFGAMWTGARVAAFNTWAKAWDLEYLLGHAAPRVLVMAGGAGSNDLLSELRTLLPEAWEHDGPWRSDRFPGLEHLVVIGEDAPPGALRWDAWLADAGPGIALVEPSATEPAFVLYTSGSSAYPKAVPLLHHALVENAFNIGERMAMVASDRVWLASPLFWSFGSANAMMATFTHGASLVLQPTFDARAAAELIAERRCTVAYVLPAMVDALAAEAGDRLGTLRTGVTIGRPDEIRRVVDELGIRGICNVYGSTETYGNCCVTPWDMPLEQRLRCQGPPLPGVELRIVDPDSGTRLAPGAVGEIQVRGYITPGYVGDPTATAAALTADQWLRMGDLGSIDDDGCLVFAGRATEMIKTAGINVSPAEVERFLSTHPAVAEVVVVGAPHPVKDQVVVAFVRLHPETQATGEELIAFCRAAIAGYLVPKAVVVVDEIPTTTTGKISRRALRDDAARVVVRHTG